MTTSAHDILARLPHGPSFRFITRLRALDPGVSITAEWTLDGAEPFFAAHFPGEPIVPGVLLTEALAQAAGLAVGEALDGPALLAHIDVRLHEPVRPPATITLEAALSRRMGALFLFDVTARINETTAATGRLTLAQRSNHEHRAQETSR